MKKTLPFLLLFFALFLVYPLANLLGGSFFVERIVDGHATRAFSFAYYGLIFANPLYRECFANSFLIALWSTALALLLALPLAQLFLRRSFPGKKILYGLLLLPLILPPFVGAIGLKQFFARFGSLNLLLDHLGWINPQHPPDWFGAGGFVGIVFLEVLHLLPILFLSLQAALANVDPAMRDAARNLGARPWRVLRTVTLPLAMPGIFAGGTIVFISAFTDLGTPLIFDFQRTVPTQVFNLVTLADNPLGYALVVLTLAIVSALFLLARWGAGGDFATLARGAAGGETAPLGRWPGLLAAAGVGLLVFVSVLPHLGVVVQSFSAKWFFTVLPAEWSASYYREVFSLPLTGLSLRNSLVYAGLSAGLDLGLGLAIAFLLAREKFAGRGLLDALAMLPLALPGLVTAFAFLVAFSHGPFPTWLPGGEGGNRLWLLLFDPRRNPTLLLVVAYALHRLPYIVRAATAGLQQTSVDLEQASANLGARPRQTLWRITLPLIAANVAAGTVLTFAFSLLDVSNGMVLAQESRFYPVTKAIYQLLGRITPTAPSIACALGVVAMGLLGGCLFLTSRLLARTTGRLAGEE
jgi:iron(III) transport system permease protein